jgi:hypothetical protein
MLAMRPVVPESDWVLARLLQWLSMVLTLAICVKNEADDTEEVGENFTFFTDITKAVMGIVYWIVDKATGLDRWWKDVNGPQYLKILLTYMQVLGSFTMFSVEWPPELLFFLVGIKGVIKLDIFSFPSFACLGTGIRFEYKVVAYTLTPLFITVLIYFPVPVARLRGYSDKDHPEHSRSGLVQDKFWTNLMFMLFVLYPTLALTTMQAWQCEPLTGLMTEDFRQVCPPPFSNISLYSMAAFLLYPFGIPLFMNIVLRLNNIRTIVADKMDKAYFDAMLALYCKRACPLEAQCFARLVGSADDDEEEFKRQARHAFQKIIRQQQKWGIEPGQGKEELLLNKLLEKVIDQSQNADQNHEAKETGGEHAMTGVSLLDLCSYMKKHDTNGDGSIDFDEFMGMIKEARSLSNIFTGSEKAPPLDETLDQSETLSDVQIEKLLLHQWPKANDSTGQDEREGLGGLTTIVKASMGKKTPKDYRKNLQMLDAMEGRQANVKTMYGCHGGPSGPDAMVDSHEWTPWWTLRTAIVDPQNLLKRTHVEYRPLKSDFNRQDQQLVMISDMVDVLNKLEEKKESEPMPSWYQNHDWKEDIRRALEVYIKDTDGRTPSDPNAPSEQLKPLLHAINVRTMSKKQKLEALYQQARTLINEGVTAIPPMVWSKHGEDDDHDIVHVIEGLQKLEKVKFQKPRAAVPDQVEYRDLKKEEKAEIAKVVAIYEAEKLAEEQGEIVREIKQERKTDLESHKKEERDAAVEKLKDLEKKLLEKLLEQGDTDGRKPLKHSTSSENVGLVHTRAFFRSSKILKDLVQEVQAKKLHLRSLDQTRAHRDNKIINRLGFLFVAYRVEFWYELPWGFPRSPLAP